MKISARIRGWTSGRHTPSLRPTPYAAETANPAGRHLSFAEICPDNRSQLLTARAAGAGDVVAYNYFDDHYYGYGSGSSLQFVVVDASANVSHASTSHHTLFEWNWAVN